MSLSKTQQAFLNWLQTTFATHEISTNKQWHYAADLIQINLADKVSQKRLRSKPLLRCIRERAYQALRPEELHELKINLIFSSTVKSPIPAYQRDRRYEGPIKLQKSETLILVNLDMVQYEGTGGFKIIQEPPSQAFAELVLTTLKKLHSILRSGLAKVDWSLLEAHTPGNTFTRAEIKNILACYRNLIDAWKNQEAPRNHLDFHYRGFATFLGLYVGKTPRMNLVLTDGFRLNTSTYIKDQLKDPGTDNNFLLRLNMMIG